MFLDGIKSKFNKVSQESSPKQQSVKQNNNEAVYDMDNLQKVQEASNAFAKRHRADKQEAKKFNQDWKLVNFEIDKNTGLTRNLGETDEEFELRVTFRNYIINQGHAANLADAVKNQFGTEWSSEKVEAQVNEKLLNHDVEGAKALMAEYSKKQDEASRTVSKGIGLTLGGIATGGAGLLVGGGIAAVSTTALEVSGKVNPDKEELKTAALDGVKTGSTTIVAGGAGQVINGVGSTAATTSSKILHGTLKGAGTGGAFGLADSTIDDGVDYAIGDKDLSIENIKNTGKKVAEETTLGAVSGGVIGGVAGSVGVVKDKIVSVFKKGSNSGVKTLQTEKINPKVDVNTDIKQISERYPNIEAKDVKAFVNKAHENGQNPQEVLAQLEQSAKNLSKTYKGNVSQIQSDYSSTFGDISSIESVSARSKGENSILSKFINKYSKGKLDSTEINELAKNIGDGYGTRVVVKDLNPEQSKAIVEKALDGKMSYEEFTKKALKIDSLDVNTRKTVQKGLDSLKEAQTDEFVNTFVGKIKKGSIELADDEFNNYGSEITSYFTDEQLKKIANAYQQRTGKPLTVVNKTDLNNVYQNAEQISFDEPILMARPRPSTVNTISNKAVKQSGYTTTQANLKTKYTTGESLADTEIQIRGTKINEFAEIEHVPYDIRQGKKTAPEYNEIRNIMRGMSEESYNEYSKYLSDTYRYHRLNELGVQTEKPILSKNLSWNTLENLPEDLKSTVSAGQIIDSSLINKITEEGLLKLHAH